MDDFGEQLRKAREGRGISLRQIASTTKISVAALEALERNDLSKLPGGVFSRALVRSYAAEVGLDPDKVVNEFLDRFQGDPLAPEPVGRVPAEEVALERRRKYAAVVFVLAIVVMLAIAAAVTYILLLNRPV